MTNGLALHTPEEQQLFKEQQVILDNAGVGICFIRNRLIQRCNRQFAHIYGYTTPEDLIGTSSERLYPDSLSFRQLGVKAYPRMLRGERFTTELQMIRLPAEIFWCRVTGNLINVENPTLGSIWIIEDIDRQRRDREALDALHYQQQLILDHATVGIAFMHQRRFSRSNDRIAEMFGYTPEELSRLSTRVFYPDRTAWEAAGRKHHAVLSRGEVFCAEVELVCKDGSTLWCDLRSKAINPAAPGDGSIWIIMDISDRKRHEQALLRAQDVLEQRVTERTRELESVVANLHREIEERRHAEERIRHLAQHDSLTGLPNRRLFEQGFELQLAQAAETKRKLAILFIDLDRFKHINDSLGHHEGDQLLHNLADRLREACGHENTLARIGGDEFIILLNHVEPYERIEQLTHRLQNALQPSVYIGRHEFNISASIGVAIYPHDGTDIQTLIKHADTAMCRAKANGGNRCQFYNHHLDREAVERIELRNALYQALPNQEFELHYQPQVSVHDARITCVEALIRWHHPDKGTVAPDCFIPLAEESGLIKEIGSWVLDTACQQLKTWRQAGLDLRVAVNLSAAQLDDMAFYQQVKECLERYELQPRHLELELTESILMRHVDHSIRLLNKLDQLGVHLSIDDFGTGYSSLSYLKRLPLDTLKIDRSFVRDLCTDQDDAVICRTIISMANNLKLSVTAEGVERAEQLHKLAEFGCDLYQGYLFSRPLPASDITRLYREYTPPENEHYTI
ncbi:sensor domain-containing protein [Marinobacterium marinum]|uniref:cyclic-guanylate-specific phosphodiesterase n=1 Tax=Marinobacterium marinum TaxID=2756129 RepID=A0A7W1WY44_9GAMM|nr:EAL domain-containing protein [Marinobacterium marinum]MBA4502351.1 EAL domain-containing protein [Marinobacterium marinum]